MAMNTNPQPRRISLVTRTLKPVQQRIGQMQEAAAFLAARNHFAAKAPDNSVTAEEVAEKRRELEEIAEMIDASLMTLPVKLRRDSRVFNARLAIGRLDDALARLAEGEAQPK